MPPTRMNMSVHLTFCSYCSQALGLATTPSETVSLHRRHNCPEKKLASQPAICVPFS